MPKELPASNDRLPLEDFGIDRHKCNNNLLAILVPCQNLLNFIYCGLYVRPLTLKPTNILRCPSSCVTCAGASVNVICATCWRGIVPPSGRGRYRLSIAFISLRKSLSIRTTKSNRLSPSNTYPERLPAKAVSSTLLAVLIEMPYLAS